MGRLKSFVLLFFFFRALVFYEQIGKLRIKLIHHAFQEGALRAASHLQHLDFLFLLIFFCGICHKILLKIIKKRTFSDTLLWSCRKDKP